MNTNPPRKFPAAVTSEPQDIELEDQIRQRAYELYEERGREDGHELDDWLRAEAEIMQKKARTTAA
jgi:P-type Cu2+ transporter